MCEILYKLTYDLPFHNILNVDLLKYLAGHHEYMHLIESIDEYESTYFSMKLNDVLRGNRRYIMNTKITKEGKEISHETVRTKLHSHYTIYEFKDFTVNFSDNVLHIDVGQLLPEILEEGCVCVKWLIPSQLADYVYHSACINAELFRELQLSYLEVGSYKIEPVKGSDEYSKYVMYVQYNLLSILCVCRHLHDKLVSTACTLTAVIAMSNSKLHHMSILGQQTCVL